MRLSELVSNMSPTFFTQVAFVLFLLATGVIVYTVDWSSVEDWTDLKAILESSNDKIHVTVRSEDEVKKIRHLLKEEHRYDSPRATGECRAPGCRVRMYGGQEYCDQHELQKNWGII